MQTYVMKNSVLHKGLGKTSSSHNLSRNTENKWNDKVYSKVKKSPCLSRNPTLKIT